MEMNYWREDEGIHLQVSPTLHAALGVMQGMLLRERGAGMWNVTSKRRQVCARCTRVH